MLRRKFEILKRKLENVEEKVWKFWGESFENVEEKVWKFWGEILKILRRKFENVEEKVENVLEKDLKYWGEFGNLMILQNFIYLVNQTVMFSAKLYIINK